MKNIEKGDHIYYKTNRLPTRFTHHGIYCGNDRVIHLNAVLVSRAGFFHGEISEVSLAEFLGGVSAAEIVIDTSESDSPEEVIQRARSYSKNSGTPVIKSFGKYSIHGNNCEHFANFCQTGIKHSGQVLSAALDVEKVGVAIAIQRNSSSSVSLFKVARIVVSVRSTLPPQLQPVALTAAGVVGAAALIAFGAEKGAGAVGSFLKRASVAK